MIDIGIILGFLISMFAFNYWQLQDINTRLKTLLEIGNELLKR